MSERISDLSEIIDYINQECDCSDDEQAPIKISVIVRCCGCDSFQTTQFVLKR